MNTRPSLANLIGTLVRALGRACYAIFTVAVIYGVSILIGIVMVHAGNSFALTYRDQLVRQATQQNPAALAANQGDNLQAALWDFAGNLVVGAIPKTVSGFAIVFPYPWVAHQGWVGGIVSVRGDHTSRLNDPRSAIYYLLTLVLQVIPYSLAVGAGVNVGVSLFRPAVYYQDEKWLGIFFKGSAARCGSDLCIRNPLIPGGLAVGVSEPVESVGASKMLGWAPSTKIKALPNRGVQPTLRG